MDMYYGHINYSGVSQLIMCMQVLGSKLLDMHGVCCSSYQQTKSNKQQASSETCCFEQ
jgi:hypothetical protein